MVLVATRNPLNLGAAARAMSNFGFSRLRVVAPYEAAYREARSAVGASELLANAEEYASVAEAVADCTLVVGTTAARNRELAHRLLQLEEGAGLIRQERRAGRVALLFGSEKRGLSNRDLSHCHWLMRLPTREEHPSMNLGQAVAVSLYEVARDPDASLPQAAQARRLLAKLAAAGEIERLTSTLLEALRASGYANSQTVATEEKVRRLIRRLELNTEDAETLLGMLRQILWKIRSGE